jgi:outer membrane immunogenic protein
VKSTVACGVTFLALAIAPAMIAPAIAADLPVYKAPAAVVVAQNWAGPYVGVQGGYAWGRAEKTDDTPFTTGRYDVRGALVGGTLGYNWQNGSLVYGVETDLAYAWIKGSTIGTDPASGNCVALYCDSEIKALGTLRGRFGVAYQNTFLPYVTGGLAYANVRASEGVPGAFLGSGSDWVVGWTVGAGLEAKVAPNWSVKAEYLYVDLGNHDIFTVTFGGLPFAQRVSTTAHVARVGLNYHFQGPIAARF